LLLIVQRLILRKIKLKIAALKQISKDFNLSAQTSGLILAFGTSIPEFSTNLASTSDMGSIEIGLGTITGSGAYGKV
jgi:Ca2+/Na+ antiporter